MNKDLIWNFAFNEQTKVEFDTSLLLKPSESSGPIKWEVRFFWSEGEQCNLNALTDAEVALALYEPKNHKDYYYLIPGYEYNLKKRYEKIFYKPLVERSGRALGFGAKQILEPSSEELSQKDLLATQMLEHINQRSIELYVQKEAFVYSFPSSPKTKLELGRVEVLNKVFYTACVEGRSYALVEQIAHHLAPQHQATDYVHFLQQLVQS